MSMQSFRFFVFTNSHIYQGKMLELYHIEIIINYIFMELNSNSVYISLELYNK
jgi:hypothetical protein